MWCLASLVLLIEAGALAPELLPEAAPREAAAEDSMSAADEDEDDLFPFWGSPEGSVSAARKLLRHSVGGYEHSSYSGPATSRRRYATGGGQQHRRSSGGIGKVLCGFLMWCFVPCLLFNNEKIAVKQAKLQGKAMHQAIVVKDIDREPIEELNGRILFLSGASTCDETLADEMFLEVTATNSVKLRRIVEMYQWVEEEEENDDKVKYYKHTKEWRDTPQTCPGQPDGHENPPMPLPSTQRSTDDYRASMEVEDGAGEKCATASTYAVRFGAYYLGEFVRRELSKWQPVRVKADQLSCSQLSGRPPPRLLPDGWVQYGSGRDIGDIRVRFEKLQCGPLSLCGVLAHVQGGYTFVPVFREGSFKESCAEEFCLGNCLGGERLEFGRPEDDAKLLNKLADQERELESGELERFLQEKTAYDQHFYQAENNSMELCCPIVGQECARKSLHWLGLEEEFLGVMEQNMDIEEMMRKEAEFKDFRHCSARVAGLVIGIIASSMIISPITYILNYNWLISMMGGAALSCLISCLACCCSLCIGLITIGIAWFNARRRLSITIFAVAACCALAGLHLASGGHSSDMTTTPAPASMRSQMSTMTPTVKPDTFGTLEPKIHGTSVPNVSGTPVPDVPHGMGQSGDKATVTISTGTS
eukprot:gnl/TRDRNA2_/TRDRNA2_200049_c0_seq1.p1 gnl/TRDRNA2_/TRDRNA2_200049_c0~~gnl/TRDRNA2_/TRDRNA2_200049_c0_seq1.p1  ORF type:complete len:646 (+),score=94.26 gnl/TRDRNA2_/TRDRNA2_200049_c0_seq1:67-2004(+)